MREAKVVTFGGSGLERRAELRANAAELAQRADAQHLAFWNGKPLLAGDALARLPGHEEVLEHTIESPVFLGCEGEAPVFAHDVSAWLPPEGLPDTLGAFLDPSRQYAPGLPGDHSFAELRAVMVTLGARDAELAATGKAVLGWHETHRFCSRCGERSKPAMGGWQRDCQACGGHHFPRTDPVVIMLITLGNSLLLGRSPGWPEGMYSLLAGFIEPGETVEAAVRREVLEETGIPVGDVRYLASQPWPFPASLMMGCAGTALARDITLDPAELEDAMWISREDLLEVFAGRHPKMRAPRQGAIARFIMEGWLEDSWSL